jgi:hypothetical protein
MANRPADKLQFAKRAAAALGYIGLASEDRIAVSVLGGRVARRRTALRGSGRIFRLLTELSAIQPADGATDLVAAARHAAAQLSGGGVVILLSDLLDPAADRVIRELASTRSELVILHVLSPQELDPPLEGDLRLVDSETGEGIDVTADLATVDAYKARLAAWKLGFADLAAERPRPTSTSRPTVPLNDLVFAELRGGASWPERRPRMPFTTPLALLGLLFVPAVVAMYLLRLRRRETVVPSTLLWQRLGGRRRGERPVAEAPPEPAVPPPAPARRRPGAARGPAVLERPAGSRRDLVLIVDTSASMARPTSPRTAWPRPRRTREGGPEGPAGRRQGQRHRGGTHGADRLEARPPTSGRVRRPSTGSGRASRGAT